MKKIRKSIKVDVESLTEVVNGKKEYRIDKDTLSVGIKVSGYSNELAYYLLEMLELHVEGLNSNFDFCCCGCPDWDSEGYYFDWYTIKIVDFEDSKDATAEFKKVIKSFKAWLKTVNIEENFKKENEKMENLKALETEETREVKEIVKEYQETIENNDIIIKPVITKKLHDEIIKVFSNTDMSTICDMDLLHYMQDCVKYMLDITNKNKIFIKNDKGHLVATLCKYESDALIKDSILINYKYECNWGEDWDTYTIFNGSILKEGFKTVLDYFNTNFKDPDTDPEPDKKDIGIDLEDALIEEQDNDEILEDLGEGVEASTHSKEANNTLVTKVYKPEEIEVLDLRLYKTVTKGTIVVLATEYEYKKVRIRNIDNFGVDYTELTEDNRDVKDSCTGIFRFYKVNDNDRQIKINKLVKLNNEIEDLVNKLNEGITMFEQINVIHYQSDKCYQWFEDDRIDFLIKDCSRGLKELKCMYYSTAVIGVEDFNNEQEGDDQEHNINNRIKNLKGLTSPVFKYEGLPF